MPIHNSQVAEIFSKVADLLELDGANPFRIRAYRNASRTMSNLRQSVAEMVERGKELSELPGIGKDLAGKTAEIVRTGRLSILEELEQHFPANLVQMMKLPGLGAKRIRALQRAGIHTIEKLRTAATHGGIRKLPGFGEKTEKNVLDAIKRLRADSPRVKLIVAQEIADSLTAWLRKASGAEKVVVAGSLRRRLDVKRLAEQTREIDRLNARLHGTTLLKSVEVDILEDGSLDLPDAILRDLDLVVGSIHCYQHPFAG